MIDAGLAVFVAFDRRFDDEEDAVRRIFEAMIWASRHEIGRRGA